jgi:hypothetical protein
MEDLNLMNRLFHIIFAFVLGAWLCSLIACQPECFFDADCTQPSTRCINHTCVVDKEEPTDGEPVPPDPDEQPEPPDIIECQDGYERKCYSGPANTEGKGVCKGGKQTCKNGQWSACESEITPKPEECNGIDDDCNGSIDDGLYRPCYNGSPETRDIGACKSGKQICKDGKWSACEGEITPKPEECNGLDDDCNGSIDDGLYRLCYTGPDGTEGKGSCKSGKQTCKDGKWSACAGEITPKPEECNGLDDDCNGLNDDGISKPCYTGPAGTEGKGLCKSGTQTCKDGTWSVCAGSVTPAAADICGTGIDENCNGYVDEGGRALKFSDPKHNVSIADTAKLFNFTGDFTIELWYKSDGLANRDLAILVNKHQTLEDTNGFHLKLMKSPTSAHQCAFSWWLQKDGGQIELGDCPANKWTHIAFVYDHQKSTYRFYVDGTRTKEGSDKIQFAANDHPLLLGGETNYTTDTAFRGEIAALRISNNARYNTSTINPECEFKPDANTFGLWNIADGGGQILRDLSTHKQHGAISGPTWTTGRDCNKTPTTAGQCTPQ